MNRPAFQRLLNRAIAIRDAVVKQEARRQAGVPYRDLDVGWQLQQFVTEFERALVVPGSSVSQKEQK